MAIATPSSCVLSCNRWFPYVCLGEANKLAPLLPPEKPPATNYAAVRSVPLPVSLTRGSTLSAADAEAEASLGRAEYLGRLRRVLGRACVLAGRRDSTGWPNSG